MSGRKEPSLLFPQSESTEIKLHHPFLLPLPILLIQQKKPPAILLHFSQSQGALRIEALCPESTSCRGMGVFQAQDGSTEALTGSAPPAQSAVSTECWEDRLRRQLGSTHTQRCVLAWAESQQPGWPAGLELQRETEAASTLHCR